MVSTTITSDDGMMIMETSDPKLPMNENLPKLDISGMFVFVINRCMTWAHFCWINPLKKSERQAFLLKVSHNLRNIDFSHLCFFFSPFILL